MMKRIFTAVLVLVLFLGLTVTASAEFKISYGILDHTMFSVFWFNGTYRCGTDIASGDYYILSRYGAEALYDVADSPNDFYWSDHRVMRRIHVEEGQYVEIPHSGLLVHAEEIDTNNWEKYGVFLAGEDLPTGDYKMVSISNDYYGAYQICNDNPDSIPIECTPLFEGETYISLKDGQYITINNIEMTFCGDLEDAPVEDKSIETMPCTEDVPFSSENDVSYSDPATIKEIQEHLNKLGYACGTADGIMGKKTSAAIKNYCADKGIDSDGRITQALIDSLFGNTNQTAATTESISETEMLYTELLSLRKSDLTKESGNQYSYNGIKFLADDCDWINSAMNTDGTVEVGAFYRKLAVLLDGFEIGNPWEDYASHIIGYTPNSRSDFAALVDSLSTFITTEGYAYNAIFDKLATLDSVKVTEDSTVQIATITDLPTCAAEMGISEEMLAYIMGAFHDYGADIVFDGQSCTISRSIHITSQESNGKYQQSDDDITYDDIVELIDFYNQYLYG